MIVRMHISLISIYIYVYCNNNNNNNIIYIHVEAYNSLYPHNDISLFPVLPGPFWPGQSPAEIL